MWLVLRIQKSRENLHTAPIPHFPKELRPAELPSCSKCCGANEQQPAALLSTRPRLRSASLSTGSLKDLATAGAAFKAGTGDTRSSSSCQSPFAIPVLPNTASLPAWHRCPENTRQLHSPAGGLGAPPKMLVMRRMKVDLPQPGNACQGGARVLDSATFYPGINTILLARRGFLSRACLRCVLVNAMPLACSMSPRPSKRRRNYRKQSTTLQTHQSRQPGRSRWSYRRHSSPPGRDGHARPARGRTSVSHVSMAARACTPQLHGTHLGDGRTRRGSLQAWRSEVSNPILHRSKPQHTAPRNAHLAEGRLGSGPGGRQCNQEEDMSQYGCQLELYTALGPQARLLTPI